MDEIKSRKVKGYLDHTLILVMLVGISSWFAVWPEDRLWNEVGYLFLILLGIPFILLAAIYDQYFPIIDGMNKLWSWVETLLVAPITGIFYVAIAVFYANWFNSIGDHREENIESEIMEKRSHLGRPFPTYGFIVLIDRKKTEVLVNSEIYMKAKIGDLYATQIRRGNLGYYYHAIWNGPARIVLTQK